MTQDQRLQEDIKSYLRNRYRLPDGREVKAETFLRVQEALRCGYTTSGRRWKNVPYMVVEQAAKAAGCKVERNARGYRIYHGGVYKLGNKAEVIHNDAVLETTFEQDLATWKAKAEELCDED